MKQCGIKTLHEHRDVSISTRIASPIPKIWLGQNFKTGHVTLTTPMRG